MLDAEAAEIHDDKVRFEHQLLDGTSPNFAGTEQFGNTEPSVRVTTLVHPCEAVVERGLVADEEQSQAAAKKSKKFAGLDCAHRQVWRRNEPNCSEIPP